MPQPLKILMVNWAWYRCAGEWTYIDNLKTLYQNHGHDVIPFSMKSSHNDDTNSFDKYFIEHIDYKELNKNKTILNGIRAFSKTIFSKEAKKNLEQLLSDHTIDIAHLHDINHYLTPSILPVLKKHKIPIIWTLHDYTLICPDGSFISDNSVCENCRGGAFYYCAIQKCKKGSFLASSLAAIENTVHRYFDVFRHVDYFLCPSQFLYNKFKDFKFYPDKLVLTNLCCEIQPVSSEKKAERYIIYAGRLVKIKGLQTLLKAVNGLDVKLYIAGEGTEFAACNSYINSNHLPNVELLGFKSKAEIYSLVQHAEMLICPSECYENFPYSIIEAMLLRTAVIASNIGGIPELVIDEITGLLFEPGNVIQLRSKITCLINNSRLREQLTENAYNRTLSVVSYQQHYNTLQKVYSNVGLNL